MQTKLPLTYLITITLIVGGMAIGVIAEQIPDDAGSVLFTHTAVRGAHHSARPIRRVRSVLCSTDAADNSHVS